MKLVAAAAHCHDCEWEYYGKNALAIGSWHNKKFNHEVGLETIHIHVYRKQKEEK